MTFIQDLKEVRFDWTQLRVFCPIYVPCEVGDVPYENCVFIFDSIDLKDSNIQPHPSEDRSCEPRQFFYDNLDKLMVLFSYVNTLNHLKKVNFRFDSQSTHTILSS